MSPRRPRNLFLLLGAIILVVGVALGAAVMFREHESETKAAPEFPTALGKHLEKLREAAPAVKNESGEGPGAADDAAFEARAYPLDDIALAKIEGAQAAFKGTNGRDFPRGVGRPGSWVSVGPSNALYPLTDFRSSYSYVPAEYSAGGRTTGIAIAPVCKPGNCRMWITPAGGGVWRTDNALAGTPSWTYLGGPFGINAAGSVVVDPNDATGNTVYVGTGEGNICGSGCVAGVGLYKSTNGGTTWTGPLGVADLGAKGIASIAIKPGAPNTIYAATTTALRGMSSVCCSGVTRPVPGAAKWGLYKSTDGGATWSFIHNGSVNTSDCNGGAAEFGNADVCSPRGVRRVVIDPTNSDVVYASSYARGVWRSSDGGTTWIQIKTPLVNLIQDRPEFAVTTLPNGKTRMYVAEGAAGSPYSRLFRSDDVRTGLPAFTDLTSSNPADTGYGSYNYCSGQCWYDNFVVTPKGSPDTVYVGGSYAYGETGGISNGRGVVLSTDAGVSFTDMTMDATDFLHPNGLHPDQHFLVTNPSNPSQFWEGNDGGVMRSSGSFADASSFCAPRGLSGVALTRCQQLLSRVPTELHSVNKGLQTLQFMSLSVSPFDVNDVQGGTQDNGTWESYTNPVKWLNTMIGDGGQSGFDVTDATFRFHNFFDASPDVNFSSGAMGDWNWIGDPVFGHSGTQFYAPMISDPVVSKTLFVGTGRTVYRTKTAGMGSMTLAEFRGHCNEWTGDFTVICGDWAQAGTVRLTNAAFGDRSGGAVAAVERTTTDASTAWAATTKGRVFISKNVDADPASSVAWTRLDSLATNDPNRFVSGIAVDPANPNHAWVSYSGFNASTPSTPGHVFEVTYNSGAGTATWVDRSYDLGDLAVTDVVLDTVRGDVYASSDFGVVALASGATTWTRASTGLPNVEVAGLTIIPGSRVLYAATHGLGAWRLNLG